MVSLRSLCVLAVLIACAAVIHARKREDVQFRPVVPGQPPFPVWPTQFAAPYDVLVPSYVRYDY